MRISIRDYRAVERADIEIDGAVTLIAGDLGVGKSSVLTGIGAVLSGEAVAWPDVLKKDLAALIRRGADRATITAMDGPELKGWEHSIEYPGGTFTSFGIGGPTILASSAGRMSMLDLPLKERAAFLSDYLDPTPSEEEFRRAAKDAMIDEKTADAVWLKICADGWDATLDAAKKRTPEAKRRWQQITGTSWGRAKAPQWRPNYWDPHFADIPEEDMAAAIEKAQTAVENAVASAAVDASEVAAKQELAAKLDERKAAFQEKKKREEDAQTALRDATTALEALPVVDKGNMRSDCPHCGKSVEVRLTERRNDRGAAYERRAELREPTPDEEIEAAQKVRREASEKVEAVRYELGVVSDDCNALERNFREAQSASRWLEERQGRPAGVATAADVETAKNRLKEAKDKLASRQAFDRAQQVHRLIVTNMAIRSELLEPSALRGRVLACKLADFNRENLKPLIDATGTNAVTGEVVESSRWDDVTVEPDFTVRWGAFPYGLVSGSQQWRARAVLQLALAKVRGDRLVVMDEAGSMLTGQAMNGLLAMIRASGVAAVIGFKEPRFERLPPLAKMELGRVYVVENGECREHE